MPTTRTPHLTPGVLDALTASWTEADLLPLPDDDNTYEIIDGRLLVSPPPKAGHQLASADVRDALRDAAPRDWRVLYEIGIAIGDDRVVPDLVVLPSGVEIADVEYNRVESIRPQLVVEIASRSTRAADKGSKAVVYAQGGIAHYWRVEMDGTLVVHRLEDDEYVATHKIAPGHSKRLNEPFSVAVTAPRR